MDGYVYRKPWNKQESEWVEKVKSFSVDELCEHMEYFRFDGYYGGLSWLTLQELADRAKKSEKVGNE